MANIAVFSRADNERIARVKPLFTEDKHVAAFNRVCQPGLGLSPACYFQDILSLGRINPKLLLCDPWSLVLCCRSAASIGLSLAPSLGQAYLIPFKDQATLVPSYRGIADLALRSERVDFIDAQVIREGDYLDYQRGGEPRIRHQEVIGSKAKVIAAYAVAKLRGSAHEMFDLWSAEDLEAHGARHSRFYADPKGIWKSDPVVAYKKTMTRQLCKRLPSSPGLMRALRRDESVTFGRAEIGELAPDMPASRAEILADGLEQQAAEQPGDAAEPEPTAAEASEKLGGSRRGPRPEGQ